MLFEARTRLPTSRVQDMKIWVPLGRYDSGVQLGSQSKDNRSTSHFWYFTWLVRFIWCAQKLVHEEYLNIQSGNRATTEVSSRRGMCWIEFFLGLYRPDSRQGCPCWKQPLVWILRRLNWESFQLWFTIPNVCSGAGIFRLLWCVVNE